MTTKKKPYYLKIAWKSSNYSPSIRIFDTKVSKIVENPVLRQWRIATGNTRYCTGYKDLEGSFVPCPDNSLVEISKYSSTCPNCFQRDPFRYRATSRGQKIRPTLQPVLDVKDDENTFVYLTLIGKTVKIGVSTDPVRRWLNQGSDYSLLVWNGDGQTARKIENNLAVVLDVTKIISFKQKIEALRLIMTENKALEMLTSLKDKIDAELDLPTSKEFDSSFFNLIQYQGSMINSLKSFSPFRQEIVDQTLIEGELAAIKGQLLVLKENQTFYVYNLHQLKGWEVQDPEKIKKRQKQKSLMDYV
ncbi:MAG: DUF2797 domain-containing protein [Candidatus Hodarchaeales archaeon]|jgi:hypothetical protein